MWAFGHGSVNFVKQGIKNKRLSTKSCFALNSKKIYLSVSGIDAMGVYIIYFSTVTVIWNVI
jgi:uncharacterized membrane protein